MRSRRKLGEALRDKHLISGEDLASALQEQQNHKALRLGELLVQRGLTSRANVADALEEITCIPYADCAESTPESRALISRATVVRNCALPLRIEGRRLVVALAEPQNLNILDELRFASGMEVSPRFSFADEIEEAIGRWYSDSDGEVSVRFLTASSAQRNEEALREAEAEFRGQPTPAVALLSRMLSGAVEKQCSDIHVEQLADEAVVRIRVDGILRELLRVPEELRNQLVSRIKILSDMDIAERRVPQDGRLLVSVNKRHLDLRVSTLPTQYGEKVVIRVLDPNTAAVPFQGLGFDAQDEQLLLKVLKQPQGCVLVTGPTASGKSTTLQSALNLLRSPGINIVTVEDPVEYVLEGINQVQVNPKAGRTFANCLRSMLRQDPNVIMVGEIRDGETAEIALSAAQTGHMVLSTLHTKDSVSAVSRLLDLGAAPFMIASSLSAVVAQRLVRKLCKCHQVVPATAEFSARLRVLGEADCMEMCLPVGCSECEGSGYKGRVGVYEVLELTDTLRSLVLSGMGENELRDLAQTSGLRLLQEDAATKIARGLTTIDEVLRVVSVASKGNNRCASCRNPVQASFSFCPHCGYNLNNSEGMRSHRRIHAARTATAGYQGAEWQ